MARRALAPLGVPVVLLKGSAFVAAGLGAGVGRSIGDLDILVPHDALDAVEAALIRDGWEWVKDDPYDDAYYRRWMHELPPLIHRARDRMIDVHHTILPPTARITPDAAALIADSVALDNGLRILSPDDMLVHAAAHLFADGDLAGRPAQPVGRAPAGRGVRHRDADGARAHVHGLGVETARAVRLAAHLYGDGAAARAGRPRLRPPPARPRRLGAADAAADPAGLLRPLALAADAAGDAGAPPVDQVAQGFSLAVPASGTSSSKCRMTASAPSVSTGSVSQPKSTATVGTPAALPAAMS